MGWVKKSSRKTRIASSELIDRGRPDDVCHLCLTSGTTGLPKGAMMTHRNYINMGLQITKVDPLKKPTNMSPFCRLPGSASR